MNGNIPLLYFDRKVKTRRYNDYLRDNLDPFNISDRRFIDVYRLPKHLVIQLIEDIMPFVENFQNTLQIPLHLEVLTTLNFLASGSHQRRVSLDAFAVMSQSKVSQSIARIVDVIGTKLVKDHIIFPSSKTEAEQIKQQFEGKYGIPGIIGLIDCTHVAIANIRKQDEYCYVNRKNFRSVNTQMICDLNLRIINVNARYPESSHDSHIWEGSKVVPVLRRLSVEDNHTWLFGDSGYGLKPYMMVPYRRVHSNGMERYNKAHSKIRSTVERCFGVLKSRFRCLKMASGHLHYDHKKVAQIIHTCAVLHNILISHGYPIEEDLEIEPDENVPVPLAEEDDRSGEANREFITNFISEFRL